MKISVAEESDIPFLCELLLALFTQEAEFSPDRQAQERGLSAVISDLNVGAILVARIDDEIVGMVNILYTVSTALGKRVALLEDLIIAPQWRGKGLGSTLLNHATAFAKEHDCKRITLLTDGDNDGAQKFYKRHGFYQSSMIAFRCDL